MSEAPHAVERAIIMAAGVGSRMYPLTKSCPKPLVKVNGKRMIDSVIQGLHHNGIYTIYVVVGHLKEQFLSLTLQYPGVKLIENPYYTVCNNISSLYVAREHISNCMILDGDQIIYNPEALSPTFERSGYNAVWCEGRTAEWLLNVQNGIIQHCSRNGGYHGWQLYSVSRWSEEDGNKLKQLVEYEFEHGNRQIYWDDIPMFIHFDKFQLGIHPMNKTDIVEFDNMSELAAVDPIYRKQLQYQE